MKKYMNFILIFFVMLLSIISFVSAKENNLKNKIIVIDAGHGGIG